MIKKRIYRKLHSLSNTCGQEWSISLIEIANREWELKYQRRHRDWKALKDSIIDWRKAVLPTKVSGHCQNCICLKLLNKINQLEIDQLSSYIRKLRRMLEWIPRVPLCFFTDHNLVIVTSPSAFSFGLRIFISVIMLLELWAFCSMCNTWYRREMS